MRRPLAAPTRRSAGRFLMAVAVSLAGLVIPALPAWAAAEVAFDPPTASGEFGEPRTFQTTFRSTLDPARVELLSSLPGEDSRTVVLAGVEELGDGTWRATVHEAGHVVPNTRVEYRFRVVTEAGTSLGPEASHTVDDLRVDWQRLEGDGVTLWWDHGDQGFAARVLDVAEDALASASDLLGVEELPTIDFFVYSDDRAFRQALGPGTRENVGGEAHSNIHTLFGLIEPRQVASDWVEEVVVHELAHIVFDEASANPYARPPRWLNEGLAVLLAKGYDEGDRAQVAAAARAGEIIPLDGLVGQFPTRPAGFSLAYAESVSAVSHFVDSFGESALVALITSFADGSSTDEAFRAATGEGFLSFEDDWLTSLGTQRREPLGPRPAEPGPVPEAWAVPASEALLP